MTAPAGSPDRRIRGLCRGQWAAVADGATGMAQAEQSSRRHFLDQRRAVCRRRYDEIHAPVYDQRWGGYCNASHLASLAELIAATSPGDELLDAACGTGKYWPVLFSSGRQVYGIDQSEGMLAMASEKYPDVPVQAMPLQELREAAELAGRFSGVLCADAMENVGPEDWPAVLDGFRAVLRPGGHAYLSVELPGTADGGPGRGDAAWLVDGEVIEDGGYHYYPSRQAVDGWLAGAGLGVVSERTGDGYWHVLARLTAGPG